MRVAAKELKPGMYLAEDLFQPGNRNIPLFSNGVMLTEKNIQQIQNLFGDDHDVLVIELGETISLATKGKTEPKQAVTTDDNGGSPVERSSSFALEGAPEDIGKGGFEPADIVGQYKDNLFKLPEYQNATKFFKTYYSNVGSILTTFSETGQIEEDTVVDLAQSAVSQVLSGTEYFDPSLLYLVEIEQWDETTFNHSFDVGVFVLIVASKMGDQFEELTSLFIAGLLHDIGKFIYSKLKLNDMDYIVKKPGRLTNEEYDQIKRHVDVERFIKDWFPNLSPRQRENTLYGIMDHHERIDGSGYLRGKSGANIAFSARLIAICDVYDALIRRRSYKTMINPSRAILMLVDMQKKGLFDRALFAKFYQHMGRYPSGGVIMTDRGIATVSRQNAKDPKRPYVLFPDSDKEVNTLAHPDLGLRDI